MSAVVKMPHPGGRPRIYDREALLEAFEAYIETTPIPIVVEFTTQAGITRDLVYSWPEFSSLLKRCVQKKEAGLERAMLNNELSTAGCIFALKQLGWRDSFEQTIKSEMMKPEDANADLERLAHNLERLCVRTHQQAGIGSKPQAEAASKPGKH